MNRVVKEIRGQKYAYDVSWDKRAKKQVWKYLGKIEIAENERLKRELYKPLSKLVRKEDRSKVWKILKPLNRYELNRLK